MKKKAVEKEALIAEYLAGDLSYRKVPIFFRAIDTDIFFLHLIF